MLEPLFRPLRRARARAEQPRSGAPAGSPSSRRLARRLADALDRAMAMGLWDHADRLARTAATLAPGYARLAEPLARLRLAQGDPDTALRIIEACGDPPASLRMLRVVCLLFVGARAEADLDLHRWSHHSSAPLDCRLLLGLLERHHDPPAAVRALRRNLRYLEDPRTLQALLLLSVLRDRPQQTGRWAERIRETGAADPLAGDLMLQSLGLDGLRADREPTPEQVHDLALELIAFEPAIAALVEAQRLDPDAADVRLLRRAVEQAVPDLAEPAEAYRSLARLAVLEGDVEAARRFAERGLATNPMSAELTLLLQELPGPTPPEPAGAAVRPPDDRGAAELPWSRAA